jgi:hypothetical protein
MENSLSIQGLRPSEFFNPMSVVAFLPSDDTSNFRWESKEEKDKFQRKTRVGNRVLIVGRLRELAIYRAEFLRQAGFRVATAADSASTHNSLLLIVCWRGAGVTHLLSKWHPECRFSMARGRIAGQPRSRLPTLND